MGANAQTSVPLYASGQILTAANMNISAGTGVPVFATTVTRDAAFGGTNEKVLAEGQMCYIEAAPKRLQVYDGSAWLDFDIAYQSFTPTFTNVTTGNGTVEFKYARFGKFVHYLGTFTMGSTSSITGNITLTTPTSQDSSQVGVVFQSCTVTDAGLFNYAGSCFFGGSTILIGISNVGGTYPFFVTASATVPFTWGTNDNFQFNIVYKTA